MEEVLAMTEEEFLHWIAYFKVKADKEKVTKWHKNDSKFA
jgi:hypothetical protein